MPEEIIIIIGIILLVLAVIAIVILAFAFWIWMIIDCTQRKFKNDTEKVVWILVVVLAGIIGAIIYYLVVKLSNPKGVKRK